MEHEIEFLKAENKLLKEKLAHYEPKAQKYRKKPLVIEAVKYESIDQIKRYFPNIEVRDDNRASRAISLKTLEGWVELQVGDYVVKGIKGEYYPCKPDIFEESYERV
ncbi:MAG: hypothetical protein Q4B28_05155 [bacterium]|nr:hypothetical protein [bacterium]